jgi:hypothetical protein
MKGLVVVLVLLINYPIIAANNLTLEIEKDQNQVAVDLILTNQDTLSGMQIPLDLSMSNLALRVDSVSFEGSRCEHFFEQFYRVYEDQDKVTPRRQEPLPAGFTRRERVPDAAHNAYLRHWISLPD